jgi:hypothetical protein
VVVSHGHGDHAGGAKFLPTQLNHSSQVASITALPYTLGPMTGAKRADKVRDITARVADLRGEFEAQLRAVSRLEHQVGNTDIGNEDRCRVLEDAVKRELTEMFENNRNIRTVLDDLSAVVGHATPRPIPT